MKDDRGELDFTRKIDELTETIEGYKKVIQDLSAKLARKDS